VQNGPAQKSRVGEGSDLGRLELDWIEPLGCSQIWVEMLD
jgi:hypothetical protein